MEPAEIAIAYHEATKHHYGRYARSPGFMDWANQPDPFRRYAGAPLTLLPFEPEEDSPDYGALHVPGAIPQSPCNAGTISWFLEHSMALSAWKEFDGARWELRCNPSSGNLHPTEAYVITPVFETPGVFHYAPKEHGLERRAGFPEAIWNALAGPFPAGVFFVGLTSIQWRETWKYGERAFRYCNHDVGHALAALSLSAASLGWRLVALDALADEAIGRLLGLDQRGAPDGPEREYADLLAAVFPADCDSEVPNTLPHDAIEAAAAGPWLGEANRLSPAQVEWPVIDAIREAAAKPVTEARVYVPIPASSEPVTAAGISAKKIFLQRRSAVEMNGHTAISAEAFFRILARVMPEPCRPPWSSTADTPQIHLGLFVHRVEVVAPGLYLLARAPEAREALRAAMRPDFAWERPAGCPPELPLFLLQAGDFRATAAELSCGQDIAGDGVFSVAMLVRFEAPILGGGAWRYPRLFWEAGMVGQMLYLEAEAAGVRGTGIGCYFDDPVHALFGLRDRAYQSVYHFTVGGPVLDPRLRTLPPYSVERRGRRD